jgi:hypothetical protein
MGINLNLEHRNVRSQDALSFLRWKNRLGILDDDLAQAHSLVFEDDDQVLELGYPEGSEIKRLYLDPAVTSREVGSRIVDPSERETAGQGFEPVIVMSSLSKLAF